MSLANQSAEKDDKLMGRRREGGEGIITATGDVRCQGGFSCCEGSMRRTLVSHAGGDHVPLDIGLEDVLGDDAVPKGLVTQLHLPYNGAGRWGVAFCASSVVDQPAI